MFLLTPLGALSGGTRGVSFLDSKNFHLGWGGGLCGENGLEQAQCCFGGSTSSVRYYVYKLYIMYINWDVSLCKLMVRSWQIKLFFSFAPPILEINLSASCVPGAALNVPPQVSLGKCQGTHFRRGNQRLLKVPVRTSHILCVCQTTHVPIPNHLRSFPSPLVREVRGPVGKNRCPEGRDAGWSFSQPDTMASVTDISGLRP